MMKSGTEFVTRYGKRITLLDKQGEDDISSIYTINIDEEIKFLKLYKSSIWNDFDLFIKNMDQLTSLLDPNVNFLLPIDFLDIKTETGEKKVGIILDSYSNEYIQLSELIINHGKEYSYKNRIDIALQILSSLHDINKYDFCFQELNEHSFRVNPKNGKVLIVDLENLAPISSDTGLSYHTIRYTAPEIICGEKVKAEIEQQRYSLSILLFQILTQTHPLEGRRYFTPCLTLEVLKSLYGLEPIFIMDPEDIRNSPLSGIQDNFTMIWSGFPEYVRELFIRAFSKELLFYPKRRISEDEWEQMLFRLRSDIISCKCGNEIFISDETNQICNQCENNYIVQRKLELSGCNYEFPIIPNNIVFKGQVIKEVDLSVKPIIRIVENPQDNNLYLQNISGKELICITPSGNQLYIENNMTVPTKTGITLNVENGYIKIK